MMNVNESRSIRAKGHGLILQITLATLITNWTIEWMVHQQELHYTCLKFKIQHFYIIHKLNQFYCMNVPSLARRVNSELVLMRHPFITGMAQAATGFGLFSTSTKHIRQLPATANRS